MDGPYSTQGKLREFYFEESVGTLQYFKSFCRDPLVTQRLKNESLTIELVT